jgi:hypothetical protein
LPTPGSVAWTPAPLLPRVTPTLGPTPVLAVTPTEAEPSPELPVLTPTEGAGRPVDAVAGVGTETGDGPEPVDPSEPVEDVPALELPEEVEEPEPGTPDGVPATRLDAGVPVNRCTPACRRAALEKVVLTLPPRRATARLAVRPAPPWRVPIASVPAAGSAVFVVRVA